MPYMKFLYVRSDVCRQLLSDSTSQWTPLLLAIQFPLLGLVRDLHPLDNARAEHTKMKLLDSNEIRQLRDVCIFEVNGIEVYM